MIALTETATSKVKELIEAEGQPELFLRVAVRPGGCSGMSYDMFFDSERADDDIEQEYGEIKVVVDPPAPST
jgi:iron-sulfur cluster assembly protein/iron-sulfur cluster insertion protein